MLQIEKAREVLLAAEASDATPVVKPASRLLALTAIRPGVIRRVTWDEFENIDWEHDGVGGEPPLWRIPSARMKLVLAHKDETAFDHLVPLSRQSVAVLRACGR